MCVGVLFVYQELHRYTDYTDQTVRLNQQILYRCMYLLVQCQYTGQHNLQLILKVLAV